VPTRSKHDRDRAAPNRAITTSVDVPKPPRRGTGNGAAWASAHAMRSQCPWNLGWPPTTLERHGHSPRLCTCRGSSLPRSERKPLARSTQAWQVADPAGPCNGEDETGESPSMISSGPRSGFFVSTFASVAGLRFAFPIWARAMPEPATWYLS
jgi:hypothetical protein